MTTRIPDSSSTSVSMNRKRGALQLIFSVALLSVPLVGSTPSNAVAQAPMVHKVEPPGWWIGMKWSEVQFMLTGDHLDGIKVRSVDERLTVTAVHTVANPHYAFVDVSIPDDLAAGEYAFVVSADGAETTFVIPVRSRDSGAGRHQGFGPEDVVYLIAPDRFANGDPANDRVAGIFDDFDPDKDSMRHGGDLKGIVDNLDYLRDLGVTALWLMPVLENNGRASYHGYALTDYYAVDSRYGGNDAYVGFVEAAHERGLKVIFDHVSNHIGVNHPWIADSPMPDWTNGTRDSHLSGKHYKLSPTDVHADPLSVEQLRGFWFVRSMPDLNQRNPFLATYLIQNTLWWIETAGLDGIREDTYPYPDQEFMARWAEAIMHEYPNFNIVGEIWEYSPAYISMFQRESRIPRDFETNLPAVMDFPLSRALLEYLSGSGSLEGVYKVIAEDFVYSDLDNLLTFIDNHDIPRGLFRADGDIDRLKVALTILLTTRGIPQLLYGTEVAMIGGESHVQLRADMPGGFPGDERSVFAASGRTDREEEVFRYVQSLLRIRQEHAALTRGELVHYPPQYSGDEYKYLRIHGDEQILVVVNGSREDRTVDLSELERRWPDGVMVRDLVTGADFRLDVVAGLRLRRQQAAVLQIVDPR